VSGSRGPELAAELEAANRELIELVERLTPAQWRLRGANAPGWDFGEDEARTVGQIALHSANQHLIQMELVRTIAAGETPGTGRSDAHSLEAAANPEPDRREVLRLLADNGTAAAAMLRGLSEEQLARRYTFRGWTMSAEELAEQDQVGHVRWHLASIRATIGEHRA
jgi:hypothetical protein